MKKLLTLMLGLAFLVGTGTLTFAQEQKDEQKTEQKKKKKKGGKKAPKKDETKPGA